MVDYERWTYRDVRLYFFPSLDKGKFHKAIHMIQIAIFLLAALTDGASPKLVTAQTLKACLNPVLALEMP